jgi:hypothetical protein
MEIDSELQTILAQLNMTNKICLLIQARILFGTQKEDQPELRLVVNNDSPVEVPNAD